ncbi:hypothetical protein CAMRE0001_1512 [Campylobacter rectus RM3267]|uniref:Uncharacterized protein n=2 Tax=Campylobacter rectus TaxID=203 RepID=A0A6G5QPC8_CAMRE|nr:hypothetical protein [Campylobacter rectus]EEF14848.1 hypothetical protein CAMRE0001_1512 [Campylobacter rectus RM3267]QCD47520.1 hypothetical protein CRECT_1900 [Campylobacter rectus]QCD47521.1 hypothetical protein CRECT_1901 [Campylobacter rectus]UEB48215.1 hypothetical protein LK437_02515 [Campylobacter rectus]UEB48216.1 hypothetical protein LK437_02520 [Campylobacter rectus]
MKKQMLIMSSIAAMSMVGYAKDVQLADLNVTAFFFATGISQILFSFVINFKKN